MIRLGTLLAVVGALLAFASPAVSAAGPTHLLYEWHPNGQSQGPELELEYKTYLSGKFAVPCGRTWIFTSTSALFDPATGAISGSYTTPVGSVGIGSSFKNAEINWYDFKSGGPLKVSYSGAGTAEKAVGTLSLWLYHEVTAKRRRGRPKPKPKRVLTASCAIHFEAPNFYYQPPAAAEAPAVEPEDG